MKYSFSYTALTAAVAVTSVFAAPAVVRKREACASPVTLSGDANPFLDNTLYANPYYANEITAAIANMTDATLIAQAEKVAAVGSFKWINWGGRTAPHSLGRRVRSYGQRRARRGRGRGNRWHQI